MSKTALLLISTLLSHSAFATVHSPPKTLEDGLYEVAADIITYEEFLKAPYFTPGKLIHFVQTNPTSPLSESGIVMLGFIKTRPAIELIFNLLLHSDEQVRRFASVALRLSASALNPLNEERGLMLTIKQSCVFILNRYVARDPAYDDRTALVAIVALCSLRFNDDTIVVQEDVIQSIVDVFDSGLLPFRTYHQALSEMSRLNGRWVSDILAGEQQRLNRLLRLTESSDGSTSTETKPSTRKS